MKGRCKLIFKKQKSGANLRAVSELSWKNIHRWMAAHPASAWNGYKKENTYSMPMALLVTAFWFKDDGCVLAASLKANLQRKDWGYGLHYCLGLFCVLRATRHLGNTSNTMGRTEGREVNVAPKQMFNHPPISQIKRIRERSGSSEVNSLVKPMWQVSRGPPRCLDLCVAPL